MDNNNNDDDDDSGRNWRMVKKSSVLSQIKSSRAFLFINNYSCNYDCNNFDGDNCNMKQGLYYITFGGIWYHS